MQKLTTSSQETMPQLMEVGIPGPFVVQNCSVSLQTLPFHPKPHPISCAACAVVAHIFLTITSDENMKLLILAIIVLGIPGCTLLHTPCTWIGLMAAVTRCKLEINPSAASPTSATDGNLCVGL